MVDSSKAEPELLADYQCVTGEGPMWHPDEKRVYWVDIPRGRLFRYDPETGSHEMCYEGDQIGGFTIQADGALLLFMDRGAVKIWRDGELTTVLDEIADERATRFNDVIADPEGRVFCGTMSTNERPGRLYRLDPSGELTIIAEDVGCSNGMGFTPDGERLYHTDSDRKDIYLYDYDQSTGALENRKNFLHVNGSLGVPDGMTVDADGNVWSANWDGGCLIRFSPEGAETMRIPFPAKKVSCVTFGGEDYTDMYVTTAGGDKKAEEGEGAGALFRLRLGVRGVPEFRSRVGL